MSRFDLTKNWKAGFAIVAIVAANIAGVASVTGVSYAASDQMMHDYSSSSMSME